MSPPSSPTSESARKSRWKARASRSGIQAGEAVPFGHKIALKTHRRQKKDQKIRRNHRHRHERHQAGHARPCPQHQKFAEVGVAARRSSSKKSGSGKRLVFSGFRRPSGGPGARNHLAVISVMDNTNPIVRRICSLRKDLTPVNTSFGRALYDDDQESTLPRHGTPGGPSPTWAPPSSSAWSPRPRAPSPKWPRRHRPWMPLETVTVHEIGGTLKITSKALELAYKLSRHLSTARGGSRASWGRSRSGPNAAARTRRAGSSRTRSRGWWPTG